MDLYQLKVSLGYIVRPYLWGVAGVVGRRRKKKLLGTKYLNNLSHPLSEFQGPQKEALSSLLLAIY